MNKQEYNKLQSICNLKIKEAKKRYPVSSNRAEGWKDAFFCMKSILSKQFKQEE